MSNTENGWVGVWKVLLGFLVVIYIAAFIWSGCKMLLWAIDLKDFAQYKAAFEIVVQKTWVETITATIAAVVAFVFGDKAKQAYVCRVEAKEREAHVKNILENGRGKDVDDLMKEIVQLKKSTDKG